MTILEIYFTMQQLNKVTYMGEGRGKVIGRQF